MTNIAAEETLYSSLESYPWSQDPSFQSGLVAILGPQPNASQSPSQLEDLHLRARCFYYTRKYDLPPTAIDFEAYKAWRQAQAPEHLSPLDAPERAAPATPDGRGAGQDSAAPRLFSTPSSGDFTSSPTVPTQEGHVPPPNGTPTPLRVNQEDVQQQTAPGAVENPEYPASFAEIMELIKTGQPIPGIKEIPNTVLVGQGTEAMRSKRKKPWEANSAYNEDDTRKLFDTESAGHG